MKAKLKDLLAEYGAIAIVVWFVIFACTWFGFAVAIGAGFDPESAAGTTGVIGAAYVATQVTKPIRIVATLAATPFVGALWHRTPWGSRRLAARKAAQEAERAALPTSESLGDPVSDRDA